MNLGYTGTWRGLVEFLDRWGSVAHAADGEIAVRYRVETGAMRHVSIRMTSAQWSEWVGIVGGFESATASLRGTLLGLHSHERTVFYRNYDLSPLAELEETLDDVRGWTFGIRELPAGGYEATGTHVSGAVLNAVGSDPKDVAERVRQDADGLDIGADPVVSQVTSFGRTSFLTYSVCGPSKARA